MARRRSRSSIMLPGLPRRSMASGWRWVPGRLVTFLRRCRKNKMDVWFHRILPIHIALGGLALFIAPLAMVTVKGGLWHRRWGKIYFWAMAGVALSAAAMCWLRSGLFLFLIAILSFYLSLTGYRVLQRKKPEDKAALLDWFASCLMLAAGAGFIVVGLMESDSSRRWVRIIFGVIGMCLGTSDVRGYLNPPKEKRAWWFAHMVRFLSAYIATVTAFSVVNFQFLPYFFRWLGPAMLGTVGIVLWTQ